mgnify:CR=1 FL=1
MSLKQKTISGVVWTFAQQFGSQIISFAVSLILARILLPSDFGTIAIFSVLMGIGSVLIDSGLTNSLIRTQDVDDTDLSTVFYFNFVVSFIVYLLIVVTAPFVADFFNIPALTNIIRVYAIILPVGAFSAIQRTLLTKRMDFKTQLKIQLPSLIVGGISGIVFALSGFGVWSLVYMAIIQSVLSSLQFWLYSKWRPKRVFDRSKFKFHFNFGYKLALSGLLDIIFQNIYTIVIGKVFNATQLGYYNKANSLQQLPVTSITGPINKVTYPLFAEIQDDNVRLKNVYRKLMTTVIFIIAPLLIIMGVLGEPLFRFLFTEKWLPAVPYFQILCIVGILLPIHSYNLNVLKVKGRSDLFLKLEIIKKILTVIAVAVTFQFGIIFMLWGRVATSFIGLAINCHYSGKYLDYSLWKQLADLLPSILLSVVVGAIILFLDKYLWIVSSDFIRLFVGGISGILLYIGFAFILKFKELTDVKEIVARQK